MYRGREIVQLYVEKPINGMGRPARELIGFAKTRDLNCLEEEKIQIDIPIYSLLDRYFFPFRHDFCRKDNL